MRDVAQANTRVFVPRSCRGNVPSNSSAISSNHPADVLWSCPGVKDELHEILGRITRSSHVIDLFGTKVPTTAAKRFAIHGDGVRILTTILDTILPRIQKTEFVCLIFINTVSVEVFRISIREGTATSNRETSAPLQVPAGFLWTVVGVDSDPHIHLTIRTQNVRRRSRGWRCSGCCSWWTGCWWRSWWGCWRVRGTRTGSL